MAFDPHEFGAEWAPAFEAVERLVGGRIVSAERQARWRPVFWVEVDLPGGARRSVCFRGARPEQGQAHTAKHEYECMRVLERQGICVPPLYGYCEKPPGFVMDKVPGRPNLATAETDTERDTVQAEFIDTLAKIHALPIEDFEAIGLPKRTTPEALAIGDTAMGIARYHEKRTRPDPVCDFLIDWCERNAPPGRSENVFLTGDAGQYLFEDGHLTAVLDMELAYLGDPMADLGALFCRDLSEDMGDLEVAIERYRVASGREVDPRIVLYHAIRFALTTPVATVLSVSTPGIAPEYVQFLAWYLVYARTPLELIAYLEGIPLQAPEDPVEVETPWSVAQASLERKIQGLANGDEYHDYEVDAARRLALYLSRADRFGPSMLEQDLDDAAKLLGHRPTDAGARDDALTRLIAENRGEQDGAIVQYLVRRLLRMEAILRPAQTDLFDVHMQTLAL